MATESDLRKLEQAFSQPSAWRYTGALGSLFATLPRIGGKSPLRVIGGRDEEMMNAVGFDTAWTDGITITFTSKFLSKLTTLGLAFVMLHEAGHIAYKHHSRRRSRDPESWNIAGDIKINDNIVRLIIPQLMENNEKLKGRPFSAEMMFTDKKPLGIGFTNGSKTWLDDFRPFMEEEIYFLLEEEKRKQRMQNNQGGGGQKPGQGQGKGGKGKGQGQGSGGSGGQGNDPSDGFDFDEADNGAFDDHMDSGLDLRRQLEEEFGEEGKALADAMDLAETEEMEAQMDQMTQKASVLARQMSRTANRSGQKGIGSHIDDSIEEAVEIDRNAKGKYSWSFETLNTVQDALMGHYREKRDIPDELSEWSRIPALSELMGVGEIFRADLRRVAGMARILVVLDTSGSMSDDDITMALTEMKSMCEGNQLEITFVSADTTSRDRIVFTPDDLLEFPTHIPIKGRGGTDMLTPLAQEIAEAEHQFDIAVVLTDGYFDSYTHEELTAKIRSYNESKVANIPPIAFVITTDHFDSPKLNADARTFPNESCKVFGLTDPELRARSAQISVNPESISIG